MSLNEIGWGNIDPVDRSMMAFSLYLLYTIIIIIQIMEEKVFSLRSAILAAKRIIPHQY